MIGTTINIGSVVFLNQNTMAGDTATPLLWELDSQQKEVWIAFWVIMVQTLNSSVLMLSYANTN